MTMEIKAKIVAFYGAEVIEETGKKIAALPNGTPVTVIDFGGNANGEYTKVTDGTVTGWVRSAQVAQVYDAAE